MKKKVLLFTAIFMATFMYAQTNDGFNYKALVTDNGNPLANAVINVKVTIKKDNTNQTVAWQEEHAGVQTDNNGIFSINMGEGTKIGGDATQFGDVYFGYNAYTYTVEINTGNGYQTLVSDEPFKRIPYAKVSERLSNSSIFINNSKIGLLNPGFFMGSQYIKNPSSSIEMGYRQSLMPFADVPYLKVDENALWIKGELHAPDSGDADMKAYAYGEWYVNNPRHTTDNVTISHISTGHYQVNFSTPFNSTGDYIVLANKYISSGGYIKVGKSPDYFSLFIFDLNNNPEDSNFTFVVFRK